MELWKLIIQSNTFNFILFMLILIWIAKIIDIPAAIDALQEKIKKMIDDAKSAKEKSIAELKGAENAVKNVETEIKAIISNAEQSAIKLGNKIMEDAEKQVLSIDDNAKKIIDAEEKKVHSSLTLKTSLASIDLAKKHIQNTLHDKPHLHAKFINDCIDELDRLKL